ncbi:MAG: hypothetical protein HYZ25_10435 [Chloroflexi bacterium]|nr:hypothetical protein [Chloroflexota bacterium]
MKQISIEVVIKNSEFSEPNEWNEFKEERNAWLVEFPYNVVVATSYLEMDNVQNWLTEKCGSKGISWDVYFYYKESYDFGYAEYFFQDEHISNLFTKEIPNFYGVFYNNRKLKTNEQGDYFEVN